MLQSILILLICSWVIWKHPIYTNTFAKSGIAIILFYFKVVTGFGLYLLYNYYYNERGTGDVNKYFDDAVTIYSQCHSKPQHCLRILLNIDCETPEMQKYFSSIAHWELSANSSFINDTRTIIRFNLMLLPLSGGAFMFHNIVANFISFTGLTLLYKAFLEVHLKNKLAAFIAVFCLPSVIFWSSGVLKEALLFFFLGLCILKMIQVKKLFSIEFLMLLFSLWGVFISKFYVALILLPAVLTYLLISMYNLSIRQVISGFSILFLLMVSVLDNRINEAFNHFIEKQKQFNNVARGGYYFEINNAGVKDTIYVPENESRNILKVAYRYKLSSGCAAYYYHHLKMGEGFYVQQNKDVNLLQHLTPANSYIYLPELENSFKSIIAILPYAIYNVLFLPSFIKIKNIMYWIPASENLLLITLCFWSLLKGRGRHFQFTDFAWFCSFFILSLILVIGFTTPILGAIVRYKIPMLPFLFYLLLSNYKFNYLRSKLKIFFEKLD